MKTFPYLIQPDSTGQLLQQVEARQTLFQEDWLQELLRKHPNILPVVDIDSRFAPLIPIGREVGVNVGSIDNLFISPQGCLVLVETKLWRNPEARREVLAQLLDYAAALCEWDFAKVDQVTRDYTLKFAGQACGVVEWVQQNSKQEIDPGALEAAVAQHLRAGDILLVVAGDRIRPTAAHIFERLERFPLHAMQVALVELQCFRLDAEKDRPLLVVPLVLAKTETVPHHVLQINVTKEGDVRVKAAQEPRQPVSIKKDKTVTVGKGKTLTEAEFWQILEQNEPQALKPAKSLVDYYREHGYMKILPRKTSLAIHLQLPITKRPMSLLLVRTNGKFESQPGQMTPGLEHIGLPKLLKDEFAQELKSILKKQTKGEYLYYPILKVDVDELIAVIDRYIDRLIRAEAGR